LIKHWAELRMISIFDILVGFVNDNKKENKNTNISQYKEILCEIERKHDKTHKPNIFLETNDRCFQRKFVFGQFERVDCSIPYVWKL